MAKQSVGGLSGVSTKAMQAELRRRERKAGEFLAERRRLVAAIGKLDEKIKALGGHVLGMPESGKRARNDVGLVESLHKLLQGKEMSVKEMAIKVREAGYRTSAENFRTMVNQALGKHKKLFKKVRRGVYTSI